MHVSAVFLTLACACLVRSQGVSPDAANSSPLEGSSPRIPGGYDWHPKKPAALAVIKSFVGNRKECAAACNSDPKCSAFEETASDRCNLLAKVPPPETAQQQRVDALKERLAFEQERARKATVAKAKETLTKRRQLQQKLRSDKIAQRKMQSRRLKAQIAQAKLEGVKEVGRKKRREESARKEEAVMEVSDRIGRMKYGDEMELEKQEDKSEKIEESYEEMLPQPKKTKIVRAAKEVEQVQIAMAQRAEEKSREQKAQAITKAQKLVQASDFCEDSKPDSFCREALEPACKQKCEIEETRMQCARSCQACGGVECEDKREQSFCREVKLGKVCGDNSCEEPTYKQGCRKTCGLCEQEAQQIVEQAQQKAENEFERAKAKDDATVEAAKAKEKAVELKNEQSRKALLEAEKKAAADEVEATRKEMERHEEKETAKLEVMTTTEKGQKALLRTSNMRPILRNTVPQKTRHLEKKSQRLQHKENSIKRSLERNIRKQKKALLREVNRAEDRIEVVEGLNATETPTQNQNAPPDAEKLGDQVAVEIDKRLEATRIGKEEAELKQAEDKAEQFQEKTKLEEYEEKETRKYKRQYKKKKKDLIALEGSRKVVLQTVNSESGKQSLPAPTNPIVRATQDQKAQVSRLVKAAKDKERNVEKAMEAASEATNAAASIKVDPQESSIELTAIHPFFLIEEEDQPAKGETAIKHLRAASTAAMMKQHAALQKLESLVSEERRVKARLKGITQRQVETLRLRAHMSARQDKLRDVVSANWKGKKVRNKSAELKLKRYQTTIKRARIDLERARAVALSAQNKAKAYIDGDVTTADLRREDAVNLASHYLRISNEQAKVIEKRSQNLSEQEVLAKSTEALMYSPSPSGRSH